MRPVYATQFEVENVSFDEIQKGVRDWVVHVCRSNWGQTVEPAFDGSTVHSAEGYPLRSLRRDVESGQLMEVNLSHADSRPDKSLTWNISIMAASSEGRLEFGMELRLGSPEFAVQPLGKIHLDTPRLVRQLLEEHQCVSASAELNVEIAARHVTIPPQDVELLCRYIYSEHRILPIILLSQDADTGEPLRPVKEFQQKLLGLAQVYEITREASYELTDRLSKRGSCFNGAVRVYWPGFREEDYRRHPLFLSDYIREYNARGSHLENHLFSKLARVAASRFSKGTLWRKLEKEVDDERRANIDRLKEEVRRGEKDYDALLEETEALLQENEELLSEKAELQDEVDTLRLQQIHYEENMLAMAQHRDEGAQLDPDEPSTLETDAFDNVTDALQQADHGFEFINVWDSAYDSAAESHFSRPSEVYEALEAISELAQLYHENDGAIGEPWEKFFEKRNIKYAAQEHETTMAMYGGERTFTSNGRTEEMQRHLTLGGGSRKECVQVYFLEDSDQFIVGYCGPHLQHYSQNT